jgi:hypothetical protein
VFIPSPGYMQTVSSGAERGKGLVNKLIISAASVQHFGLHVAPAGVVSCSGVGIRRSAVPLFASGKPSGVACSTSGLHLLYYRGILPKP